MKKVLLVLLIILFSSGFVFCGEFEETIEKAEQGDIFAQSKIGLMYYNGQGVTQNYKQSVYWFTKAAEQGFVVSQNLLGLMYFEGQGVPQDHKQAAYWITKAAKQGNAFAQYTLGLMFAEGQGVSEDYRKAVHWITKAAEQGHAEAQYHLGLRHDNGHGITQNHKKAVYWYNKAAKQGHAFAQNNLGLMYDKGEGVPQDYKQALHWYTEAAEQGLASAQSNIGVMYAYGQGVPQDHKQAAYWITKAAKQGNTEAQYTLGVMYDKGEGVPQDHKQAASWYTKAAEKGNDKAQELLGFSYALGEGVTQNYKLAYVWLSLAVAQGRVDAVKSRDFSAKKLSPQQLSEAQDFATKMQHQIDNPKKQKTSSAAKLKSTSAKEIRWVQQTLKNLGYDPGPVDGVTGARTRSVIIAFQTDIGVAPIGIINEELVAQLKLTSKISQESPTVASEKISGSGTGFFITKDGHILTCHHVVEDAARIEIYVGDKAHSASLVRLDPNSDLAILKVSGSFPALAFSPHRSAKMGQDVFTVGYPNPSLQGVSAKYTKGTISSLTGFQDDLRLYQISVPIQPGNSGGALLDENGNILGVVIAMLNAKKTFEISGSLPQNVNYAVKSLYAQAMIDTMPQVAGKLLPPSRSKANAIDNAQESTVMVVCYD